MLLRCSKLTFTSSDMQIVFQGSREAYIQHRATDAKALELVYPQISLCSTCMCTSSAPEEEFDELFEHRCNRYEELDWNESSPNYYEITEGPDPGLWLYLMRSCINMPAAIYLAFSSYKRSEIIGVS